MTTRRSTSLIAGITVAVLLLAGCGDDEGGDGGAGGGGDRPTVDELIAALPNNELDDQGKECLAQAFVDSEASDSALQAIVDAGGLAQARGVSADDQAAIQDAVAQGIRCSIADDLPSATATTSADGSSTEPGATEPATEPSTEAPTTTAG